MNQTIKAATVNRLPFDGNDPLRTQLADFMIDDNFARRLNTLSELTAYEGIYNIWTSKQTGSS